MIGLYVLVGAHDRILYVGASRDVARRVNEHRSKPWWSEVVDLEVFPHDRWEDVLATERIYIRAAAPKYNRLHTDPLSRGLAGVGATIHQLFDEVPS